MTREMIDDVVVDYSEIEEKFKQLLDSSAKSSLDTLLIIDHLPKIDKSKEEKLLAVLRKNIFASVKAVVVPESIFMPRDEDSGMSKGYLFVEFETFQQAQAVQQLAHGYRLDKQHVLTCVNFADVDRLLALNEEYHEPTIEPFEEKEYLRSWLNDPAARDQFATLAGSNVSLFWNCKTGQQPELVHARQNWTDSYIQWSPSGSYLVTLHGPGAMLWGGANFTRLGKFPHPNVRQINFSSNESLMVTGSYYDALKPNEPNILVWDVVAGKLVRGFVEPSYVPIPNPSGEGKPSTPKWPIIKFSYDDKYATRIHDGQLYIYEVPSFALLDKRADKIEGLIDCSWSPVDHLLVYWTSGTEDIPSRLTLVSIPSRILLCTKNLFNVNSCQVHWQSRGHYLCVQVERHTKNRRQTFSNLELFRLKEKGVPVDVLEIKDPLVAVAWEPESDRFLTATYQEFKTTITFYTMKAQENGLPIVKLLFSLERKALDKFLWAPHGEFLFLMGTESTSATLEFLFVASGEATSLASREQFLGTDAAWDPSGRYLASWVSAWRHKSDNGFIIWDARGEAICRLNTPRMAWFGWRPRPSTLLSVEQQKEVKKNLKNYAALFEEADLKALSLETTNTAQAKKKLVQLWNEWRRHCRREFESRTSQRRTLLDGRDEEFAPEDALTAEIEEWIEEVIEETTEIVN